MLHWGLGLVATIIQVQPFFWPALLRCPDKAEVRMREALHDGDDVHLPALCSTLIGILAMPSRRRRRTSPWNTASTVAPTM